MADEAERMWYYAEKGQQKGPVPEIELGRLASAGVLTAETMVWTAGMENWQPFGQVRSATPRSAVADSGEVVCGMCGQSVARNEAIQFDRLWVCAACKPDFVQKLKENAETPGPLCYAGFGIRAGAWLIDWIIATVINYAIVLSLGVALGRSSVDGGMAPAFGLMALTWFVPTLVVAIYTTLMVGRFGATLGKMACGLKVVMPDGGPVSYGRACGRHFATMLSGMFFCIGYLMAAYDKEERRTLHDRICNTRVIRARG
ncbi:MAG: RDD family protein [Kiritimatiellae bacterium]|nr:RDD family protein [Kiritimatiellia bacterium]